MMARKKKNKKTLPKKRLVVFEMQTKRRMNTGGSGFHSEGTKSGKTRRTERRQAKQKLRLNEED